MEAILIGLIILLISLHCISWLFVALIVYFIPFIIAFVRKHENTNLILVLNLFLGWTFLGWLAALLWALNSDVQNTNE